jgi:hypothetical protein
MPEWTCAKCGGINPGEKSICLGCNTPRNDAASSNIPAESNNKNQAQSPIKAALLAAGVVFLIAVLGIVALTMMVPNPATVDLTKMDPAQLQAQSQMYKNAANVGQAIETLFCPASIIAALAAYFVAKGKQ